MKQLIAIVGVHFKKALFVPSLSVFNKVGSYALTPTEPDIDLSWQFTLQRVWENLMHINKGIDCSDGNSI